jgi:uncharacterized membrane protein (DUF2068 family)
MSKAANGLPVGLRTIAIFGGGKGVLAFAAACGLLSLRNTDLHAATDAFLLRHGIDPERHYTRLFIESVAHATHHHAGQIALFGFVYALVRFAESYGLWWGKHWAEWFAVISASIYLPWEIAHFVLHPRPFTAGVIAFNLTLILYLGRLLAQQRASRLSQLNRQGAGGRSG